jgi:multidrug efflux pump subunit AcrA (membrane-fusion protein)
MSQPSPRFKRDLLTSAAEVDGVAFVDVQDPGTGQSFRFYDYEYQLALQLDGQPVDRVVAWAGNTYGLELTAEGVAEFAGKLGELGFLEQPPGQAAGIPRAADAQITAPAPAEEPSSGTEWLSGRHAMRAEPAPPDHDALDAHGQDLTPVIPDALMAEAEAEAEIVEEEEAPVGAAPLRATPTEPSGAVELSPEALTEVPDSGPTRAGSDSSRIAAPAPLPAPAPRATPVAAAVVRAPVRAASANGTESRVAGGTIPGETGRVKLAPPRASAPPPGVHERRQPPAPDRVVMSPVQEEGSRGRFTAPPPARASRRGSLVLLVVVILGGGGAGAYYYKWKQEHPDLPRALRVRVVTPKPTAVYRWFSTAGAVVDMGPRQVSFESAGRLAEVLPTGASFEAGETLAKLQSAGVLETELGRHQSRVAEYEHVRDSMKAAGNEAEVKQAEAKLTEKKKLVDETQAALAKVLVKAPEPGQVTESLVRAGGQVSPRTIILKWKGRLLHGDFTLDEEDFATAGKLDFCRVEVSGPPPTAGGDAAPRFVDCKLPPPAPPPSPTTHTSPLLKFAVTLPNDAGLTSGQPLRLARLRYDGVFPLPPSAVVHDASGDKVWVASSAGVAQLRNITIAESREEALVTKGLELGDEVILDPPADLQEGSRVVAEH